MLPPLESRLIYFLNQCERSRTWSEFVNSSGTPGMTDSQYWTRFQRSSKKSCLCYPWETIFFHFLYNFSREGWMRSAFVGHRNIGVIHWITNDALYCWKISSQKIQASNDFHNSLLYNPMLALALAIFWFSGSLPPQQSDTHCLTASWPAHADILRLNGSPGRNPIRVRLFL